MRGAFLEHADRVAVGVALDPAVGRVEAVAGDAGQLQGRELTQAPWPSRLGRYTGRSGAISSSGAAVGTPPGKASIDQPPPVTQPSPGCGRRSRG